MDHQHFSARLRAAITPPCRLPGCDGFFHEGGECATYVGKLPFGEGDLTAELVSPVDGAGYLAVYAFDLDIGQTQVKTTDPAEARALAAKFRAFADAIDAGARQLEQPAPRRIAAVGRIIRKGHRTLTVRATPAGVTGSIRTAVTA